MKYTIEQQREIANKIRYIVDDEKSQVTYDELLKLAAQPLSILANVKVDMPYGMIIVDELGMSYFAYDYSKELVFNYLEDSPIYTTLGEEREELCYYDLVLMNGNPVYEEDFHDHVVKTHKGIQEEIKSEQPQSTRTENYTFQEDKFCLFPGPDKIVSFFVKGTVVPQAMIDGATLCDSLDELNWTLVATEEEKESFIADLLRSL